MLNVITRHFYFLLKACTYSPPARPVLPDVSRALSLSMGNAPAGSHFDALRQPRDGKPFFKGYPFGRKILDKSLTDWIERSLTETNRFSRQLLQSHVFSRIDQEKPRQHFRGFSFSTAYIKCSSARETALNRIHILDVFRPDHKP